VRRIGKLIGVLAVVLPALVGASPALASSECEGCAPWWHLTAGARPAYLDPASGRSEIQEVVTIPKGGAGGPLVFVLKTVGNVSKEFAPEPYAAGYGDEVASKANIQKFLESGAEGKGGVGAGNVTVSERPGENGAVTYKVESVGADRDREIRPIEKASALEGHTELKAVTEGRPSGEIYLDATNLGDADANGEVSPVVIKDKLPQGVTAVEYEAISGGSGTGVSEGNGHGKVECELGTPTEPETTTCLFAGKTEGGGAKILPPYGQIEVRIGVAIGAEAQTGELNDVSVSGGGAQSGVSIARPLTLVKEPGEKTPFGLEEYELTPENENGTPDTLAGSHPFQTTVTVDLNQGDAFTGSNDEPEVEPAGGLIKDLRSKLPPGLIGNPTPFAKCSQPEFQKETCPAQSIVGVATGTVNEPAVTGLKQFRNPVFNLETAEGESARFGFLPTKETPVFINASVRSGEDYGVSNATSNIIQVAADLRAQITFWGVPGDPRHNSARAVPLQEHDPPPFFVLPTTCTGRALESVAEVDPWSEPGHFVKASTSEESVSEQPMPTLDGCERLPFEPSIAVTPDSTKASSPTGLNVDLHVPQEGELDGASVAASAVKTIALALPAGFALDPSASDGLEACSEGLVGFQPGSGVGGFEEFDPGSEPGVSEPAFTPYLPGSVAAKEAIATGRAPAGEGTLQPGVNFCPDASKVGEVTIETPLLPAGEPLQGGVYLAAQAANPFGGFLAIYIVAEDPTSGMLVKLPGEVSLNGATGQITVTFQNTPQVAFEDIEMHFFGGERALLASPARCGAYTTNASFVPWSAEPWDEAAVTVHSSSTFSIDTGPKTAGEPGGSSCPGAQLPFSPTMTAGTTSIDAGSDTPLTVTISRDDGQQALRGFQLRLPPGLEGLISSVPLCQEAQANAGACGPASQIGETTVSAGVGGDPYTLAGGKVYLTEKYEGAPFGLAIVTPVKAGPLDLEDTPENHPACDCLVVRAKIEVDPQTAQLTIATGSGVATGTGGIPSIIDGIPLQIRDLNITIGRAGFVFNPTDCASLSIAGTIAGDEGATASVSSPFRVANCASLKFVPKLTASTSGRTSRQIGASLHVKLAYPKAPQANLASVKVDLPKQLVSRLATLQGACLASVFEQNSAACPATSRVGTASVSTPVLPVRMSGPAYFVSHGGKRFPELIVVLQGDGVTFDLHGETLIDSAGVTSTTFRTIPDVPVQTFELNLPEGSGSALAANGKLCQTARTVTVAKRVEVRVHGRLRIVTRRMKKKVGGLEMPTALTAHNGAVIHQNTPISVTGCPTARPKAAARKARGPGGRK